MTNLAQELMNQIRNEVQSVLDGLKERDNSLHVGIESVFNAGIYSAPGDKYKGEEHSFINQNNPDDLAFSNCPVEISRTQKGFYCLQ